MLSVERQLGRAINTKKEDFAPKTFTKQEIKLKTASSGRELPISDYVFEAILEEQKLYEKRRNLRKKGFSGSGLYLLLQLRQAPEQGFSLETL